MNESNKLFTDPALLSPKLSFAQSDTFFLFCRSVKMSRCLGFSCCDCGVQGC